VLLKRYNYRIIFPLPRKAPKLLVDEEFMEDRRKALYRYVNFISNHPILQYDHCVVGFLTWKDGIGHIKNIINESESPLSIGNIFKMGDDVHNRILIFKSVIEENILIFSYLAQTIKRMMDRIREEATDFGNLGAGLRKLSDVDCRLDSNQTSDSYLFTETCAHIYGIFSVLY
jgi:hypothetical protein